MIPTVKIFIGTSDPALIIHLSECQSACCVVDPDDVSKFSGALPAFLAEEEKKILYFTMNVFKEDLFPSIELEIETCSGKRLKELKKIEKRLKSIIDAQIEELKLKRTFDEIHFVNTLFNLPHTKTGQPFRLLEGRLKKLSGTVILSKELSVIKKALSEREKLVVFCPLRFLEYCLDNDLSPDFITAKNPEHLDVKIDPRAEGIPVISELTANPLCLNSVTVSYWATLSGLLPEFGLTLGESYSPYCGGQEFSILAALTTGITTLLLEEKALTEMSKEILDQHSVSHRDHDHNIKTSKISEQLSKVLKFKVDKQPSVARCYNTLAKKIEKYSHESPELRAVLWSLEYQSLVKITNGWIPYHLLNFSQKDLDDKIAVYMELINDLKNTAVKGRRTASLRRKDVVNKVSDPLLWNPDFEIRSLMKSNREFAELLISEESHKEPENLNLYCKGKFEAGLRVIGNDIRTYEFACEKNLHDEMSKTADVQLIMIPGIMNGQLQLACKEYYPEVAVLTLEPNKRHFYNLLRYVPVVSMMGHNGIWMNGSIEDLVHSYENLLENSDVNIVIADPDPQGLRMDLLMLKTMLKFEAQR